MNEKKKVPLIDVDGVIAKSNSKLLKLLPGFVVRHIKKVLYQDKMNAIIINNHNEKGVDFGRCILRELNLTYKYKGEDNLQKDKRYIFVANHPIGGVDGVAMMCFMDDLYGTNAKTVANNLLMNIDNMRSAFIGVNKHGKSSRESIKEFDNAFASDMQLFMFPAGLISRKINGKVSDLEWKKTFLTKAIQHKRDIVPVYIHGQVSNKFYRVAAFRKLLRIKANIEMFFIPQEQFKQGGNTIELNIGKPIPYNKIDKSKSNEYWINYVREKVYSMGAE